MPQPGGVVPRPGGVVPRPGGVVPRPGAGVVPQPGGVVPRPGGVVPQPGGVVPQPGGVVPQPGGVVPQPGGVVPQPGGVVPQPGGVGYRKHNPWVPILGYRRILKLEPPAGHSWHSWPSWARHDEWYDGAGAECVSRTRRVRPRVRCGGMGARRSRRRGCWWQYCRAPLQLRAGAYHSSWRPRQDDWYVAGAMVGRAGIRVSVSVILAVSGGWLANRGSGQGLS